MEINLDQSYRWKLVIFAVITGGLSNSCEPLQAQIIPDTTLGEENSIVRSSVEIQGSLADLIEGGALRDDNLFHSFREFSVDTGAGAYFANPEGVTNILTRVTGENPSLILGTLGVTGNANLFLLNPQGVIFGANAQLDVAGSFLASTADSLVFSNGFAFSASNPEAPPLLTVNIPLGLQIGEAPGDVTVLGAGHNLTTSSKSTPFIRGINAPGLQLEPGNTLSLVGGKLSLEGGLISAPGGRIELGSVSSGFVEINPTVSGWTLDYSAATAFEDISLSQRALVDASLLTPSIATGGSIQVQGKNLRLNDGSLILLQSQGTQSGGDIILHATESMELEVDDGSLNTASIPSLVVNETLGLEDGGDIIATAENLIIEGGSGFLTRSFSGGAGGDVIVNVDESLEIGGVSPVSASFISGIDSFSFGTGNAGSIVLETETLTAKGGGNVSSITFSEGNGGDVSVIATEEIELIGIVPATTQPSALAASTFGVGKAGNLTVGTSRVIIESGGRISSSSFADGAAGSVTVNATQMVEVKGVAPESVVSSRIISSTNTVSPENQLLLGLPAIPAGDSGDVVVNTPNLLVTEGAQVNVSNSGSGNPGTLQINADSIIVSDKGAIMATNTSGVGGNIELNSQVLKLDEGLINASVLGSGTGGNIVIQASEIVEINGSAQPNVVSNIFQFALAGQLSFSDFDQGIFAVTTGTGAAGTIEINTKYLNITDTGFIATSTFSDGAAGDILINASEVFNLDTSAVVTSTFSNGVAGDLNLNTGQFIAEGGGQILATTFASGDAGNIDISASRAIILTGQSENSIFPSGLQAGSQNNTTGSGGNIKIATPQLTINDFAQASVSSLGSGNAGNIILDSDFLNLDQGSITATSLLGQGGNLNLKISNSLQLRNGSSISTRAGTEATGGGDGGNVNLQADIVTLLEASSITTNAFTGNGGNIQISTQGLFVSGDSQVSASSQFGVDGAVQINNPELANSVGLIELPSEVRNTNIQISTGCATRDQNRLVFKGKGGLPANPTQTLRGQTLWRDQRTPITPTAATEKLPPSHLEAQGWIRNSRGQIELVLEPPNFHSQAPWQPNTDCRGLAT